MRRFCATTTRWTSPAISPSAFGEEAAAFVERQRGEQKPFFLYLAFNAVHSPLQAVEKYQARFPSITDSKRRTYAAMLSAMDDAVGRVLAALDQTGQTDRTLIFFTNDNGGPTTMNRKACFAIGTF